jgi:hypothetical protein
MLAGPEWIMALITLCQSAIASGKTLKQWHSSALNDREKEILIAASKDGIIHAGMNDFDGKFVATNTKEFTSADDPAITAHFLDAFTNLCDKGLVIHQHHEVFRLTGQGFDLGRKLATEHPL